MSKSPLDLYEADVASGELRADPVQREAATALARVYDDVTASRVYFGRRKSVQGCICMAALDAEIHVIGAFDGRFGGDENHSKARAFP